MCEEAKSGRSSCKDTSCKKPIDKGAWRIMKLSKVGDKTFSAPYHPECLMNSMRRAKWRMTSVEEIPGIKSVPEDEKASWQAALDKVHAEMKEAKENPKPKAKRAPKKKAEEEGDDSGAAAAGAGAEGEEKPKKKAAAGGKRKASAALDAEAAAGEEAEPAAKETKKKAAAAKKPAKKRARKSKRDEDDYDSAEDDE